MKTQCPNAWRTIPAPFMALNLPVEVQERWALALQNGTSLGEILNTHTLHWEVDAESWQHVSTCADCQLVVAKELLRRAAEKYPLPASYQQMVRPSCFTRPSSNQVMRISTGWKITCFEDTFTILNEDVFRDPNTGWFWATVDDNLTLSWE